MNFLYKIDGKTFPILIISYKNDVVVESIENRDPDHIEVGP